MEYRTGRLEKANISGTCKMSVMNDRESNIGRFPMLLSLKPDKTRSNHYIKSMLIHFHPQLLSLKDITMLWYLLTNVLDTDGSME
jgi:hypothetical protein